MHINTAVLKGSAVHLHSQQGVQHTAVSVLTNLLLLMSELTSGLPGKNLILVFFAYIDSQKMNCVLHLSSIF